MYLIILSTLFLMLVVLSYLLYKNAKRINNAKNELKKINEEQYETNIKLQEALEELKRENAIRRQTENELLKAKEQLAESLENAKELNELKTRFITMISHQYRNPLTVIMNITEMLPIYNRQKNQENHDKHLQIIKQQIDIMVQMLNDVLIIGRKGSTQQKLNIMSMPIELLLKDVITNAKFVDNEKHKFVLNAAPGMAMITSDLQILTHAFANLLNNAAKYSPWNTEINIEITEKGESYIIKIKDQGIGIPEQDKPLLFEAFHRCMNVGSINGNGLGLSIVKFYMDLVGGKIEFESRENFGSTFTLTLPKEIKQ